LTQPGREAPVAVLQRDHSLLVHTDDSRWPAARDALRPFAELVRLGSGFATYRLTPLSLWNAASAGLDARTVLAILRDLSASAVMPGTAAFVHETFARARAMRLRETADGVALTSADVDLLDALRARSGLSLPPVVRDADGHGSIAIAPEQRGRLKLAFAALG
jgi:DNA excision repair protein ERCC-3